MKSTFNESGRADLRRVLAQMESSAPLAPDLESEVTVGEPVRDRPTALNALIGLAAVVALILPAAFFIGRSPAEQPGNVPIGAGPPVEPSTTLGTIANTPVPAAEWVSTELPGFVDATIVHQGRFYAITAEQVLVSDDGVEWTTAGQLPARSHVDQLVSHGDLLVANGSEVTEDAAGGKMSTPKILTSTDAGETWSVALPGEFAVSVVSTPNGLVAPGWIDLDPVGDQLPRKAAVWTSEDGSEWTLAWEAEADVSSSSVATNAIWEDGLVVIGRKGPANYSEGSGKDGPEWERVVWTGTSASELSASVPTNILGYFEDLASTSLGHFALTYSIDRSVKDSSAAWRSDDGIGWTRIDVGAGWYHNSIATEGSIMIIGGDTLGYAPVPEARIWLTTDGVNWHDFDTSTLPEGLRLSSVELHNGVLVAALYSNDEVGGYLMRTRID